MSDLEKINSIFNAKINSVKTKEELQNLKTEIFGKNGQITKEFKTLGSLDPEKRKNFASHLNKKGLVLFGSHTSAKKVSIENYNFKALSVSNLKNLSVDSVLNKIKLVLN